MTYENFWLWYSGLARIVWAGPNRSSMPPIQAIPPTKPALIAHRKVVGLFVECIRRRDNRLRTVMTSHIYCRRRDAEPATGFVVIIDPATSEKGFGKLSCTPILSHMSLLPISLTAAIRIPLIEYNDWNNGSLYKLSCGPLYLKGLDSCRMEFISLYWAHI